MDFGYTLLRALASVLLYPKRLIFFIRFVVQFRNLLRRKRWIEQGRLDKVAEELDRLIHSSQSRDMIQEEAAYRLERAQAYERMGEWELAIQDYLRALAVTESSPCRLGLGRCYARIASYDRAVDYLSDVVLDEWIDVAIKAYNELGLAYVKKGNSAQAIEVLRSALERLLAVEKGKRFPDPRQVLSGADTRLADTLVELGVADDVISDYLSVVMAYPYRVQEGGTR